TMDHSGMEQGSIDHSTMDHSKIGHDMGGHDSSTPMWQWFHTEINDVIAFSWWRVRDVKTLLLSCAVVFVAGAALEWLRMMRARNRERLKADRSYSGAALIEGTRRYGSLHGEDTVTYRTFEHQDPTRPRRSFFYGLSASFHIKDTILFAIQTTLSYTIMLVFMTFSVYLCTSLVAGTAFGYFVFGRKRI
ncbi:hypothetical protein PFISCL1PPCAC_20665, partial [Pristionchus fissidentatus]